MGVGRLGGLHFLLPPLLKIVLIVLQYVAWPQPELQAEVQPPLPLWKQGCVDEHVFEQSVASKSPL